MKRYILFLILFCISLYTDAQECPNLDNPMQGTNNVPVDALISWQNIEGVTGYIISIGTTPRGTQIVDNQSIGSSSFFQPPVGLPESTTIYVTITLFFFDRPNIDCPSQSFRTEEVTTRPECTEIRSPADGAENVNIATNISWNYASRATGYRISIGTVSGGSDIANNIDVGNTLLYNPPSDLLPDTRYYVSIISYNENGEANGCNETTFRTGALAVLPGCTRLLSPLDGATNVPLSPLVEWEAVPGAAGYRVFIGKTPTDNNILNGGVFRDTSTFVFNFEDNNIYFIRIIPFNDAGDAIGCPQESFSTILGCGPYFDLLTGELVDLRPEIDFPAFVGICTGDNETVSATFEAEGFRWIKKNFSQEEVISTERELTISETGTYILEAFNTTEAGAVECSSREEFEVVASEAPTIDDVEVEETNIGLNVTILASGAGDYEYGLSPEGPFQENNSFLNIDFETEFVYVRDKNGCGIAEFQIQASSTARGFPKFFTPNGDGFNDTWQYRPKGNEDFSLINISIFNRYGRLIQSFSPASRGWDGKLGGNELPSTDYWYKAETSDGRIFTGHFSLRK